MVGNPEEQSTERRVEKTRGQQHSAGVPKPVAHHSVGTMSVTDIV
jgi:hypothetical protein